MAQCVIDPAPCGASFYDSFPRLGQSSQEVLKRAAVVEHSRLTQDSPLLIHRYCLCPPLVVVESKISHLDSLLCKWFLVNPCYQEAASFIASDTHSLSLCQIVADEFLKVQKDLLGSLF